MEGLIKVWRQINVFCTQVRGRKEQRGLPKVDRFFIYELHCNQPYDLYFGAFDSLPVSFQLTLVLLFPISIIDFFETEKILRFAKIGLDFKSFEPI